MKVACKVGDPVARAGRAILTRLRQPARWILIDIRLYFRQGTSPTNLAWLQTLMAQGVLDESQSNGSKTDCPRSRSGSGNRYCHCPVHAKTQEHHGRTTRPFRAGIRPGCSTTWI